MPWNLPMQGDHRLSFHTPYCYTSGCYWFRGTERYINNGNQLLKYKEQMNCPSYCITNLVFSQVRFTLSGGLQRGRLYVGERPGFMFTWSDVQNGLVTYRHDDTDSRKDFISFRLTDGLHRWIYIPSWSLRRWQKGGACDKRMNYWV